MFSRAVGREEHCKQMSLACVGSTCSVSATLGLPPLTAHVLSASTLLWLQAALQGVGPELRALSRPKPLRFRFSGTPQRLRFGWVCVLCDFSPPRPHLSFWEHWSGAPCVSSGELISGCDPPGGCQPSRISGSLWLETGSLFAVW